MKMNIISRGLSIAIISLASVSAWAEEELTPPVSADCSTAEADIATLNSEKKSIDERKMKGIMGVLPIGLVVNAADSAIKDESPEKMEIDEYNKKITERIEEIQKKCNISASDSVLDDASN